MVNTGAMGYRRNLEYSVIYAQQADWCRYDLLICKKLYCAKESRTMYCPTIGGNTPLCPATASGRKPPVVLELWYQTPC